MSLIERSFLKPYSFQFGSRSVSYTYDSSGNLSKFTDATAKATTFQYDLPGRITKLFYPSNPTIAFATNVYDSLGRVQTQTNANGKLYTYYFAGSRSEEFDPLSGSKVSYVDAFGKVLRSINPLNKVVTNTYDGHERLVKSVLPEGNYVSYTYDDATCGASRFRRVLPADFSHQENLGHQQRNQYHDRKLKTPYPNKTTAGASSSTDYEQVAYDAEVMKRNGQSITNRLPG